MYEINLGSAKVRYFICNKEEKPNKITFTRLFLPILHTI